MGPSIRTELYEPEGKNGARISMSVALQASSNHWIYVFNITMRRGPALQNPGEQGQSRDDRG